MQTKLKGFLEKIKGFFTKLNKKTRILLGACGVVLLLLLIAAAVLMNRKEYAVLYGGLTASETSTIVTFLSDSGVTDYQIQGDSILVPKGRETQLQAQLAMSGYPTTGFMYEYYTDSKNMTDTSAERDKAWLIAGQQYLAAVIRQFDGVREAWVQIAPGTERIYVLDPESTPATASVTIELEGDKPLSNGVVAAIRNTVAYGMEGMEVSNVSIHDTAGNTYSDVDSLGQMAQASAMKLQYEEEINNKIRMEVLQNLKKVYGPDNVTVSVNTTVDVNRRVIESTQYEQPEGSVVGGGLIGSDKLFWEIIRNGDEPVGGTVGTPTNADIPGYPDFESQLNGDEDYVGVQGERDGKLNTTTEQREVPVGTITDIGVAVTINQNSPNSGAMSVEALRDHVATIANIGSEDPSSRVSVMIAPFYEENIPAPIIGGILANVPDWAVYAAIGGLALFLVLLIIVILLARRSKKKRLAKQKAAEDEMMAAEAAAQAIAAAQAAIPPSGGADIMEVNTERSMELRKTVRQFAQNNPEIAAQMVRAWLKGEDDNG